MKSKYILTILALALFQRVFAQPGKIKPLGPLSVGDTISDKVFQTIFRNNLSGIPLSDLSGKAIIIDFWATWCGPCIGAIPKLDSIQRRNANIIQIIGITYQSRKETDTFFGKYYASGKMETVVPQLVSDTALHQLFPHQTLPHYVWIDKMHIIRAITGPESLTEQNLRQFSAGEKTSLPEKKDDLAIKFDRGRPFFIDGNGGDGAEMVYKSVIGSYVNGLSSEFSIGRGDSTAPRKVLFTNFSPLHLIQLVFGERTTVYQENRTLLNIKDPDNLRWDRDSGIKYVDWLKNGHAICYELTVPPAYALNIYKLMQADVRKLMPQFNIGVEKRLIKAYVLIINDKSLLPTTKGGKRVVQLDRFGFKLENVSPSWLVDRLSQTTLQLSPLPLANGIDSSVLVDIDIKCNTTDLQVINDGLSKYGMMFKLKEVELDVLVIEDAPSPSTVSLFPFKKKSGNVN